MISYNIIMLFTCLAAANQGVWASWTPSKVIEFFKYKNVYLLDVALCSSDDTLLLMRSATILFPGLLRPISEINYDYNNLRRVGIFLDLNCSCTQTLLKEVNEKWFTTQFTWLLSGSEDVVFNSFVKLPFSTFSNVFRLDSDRLIRLHKTSYDLPMTQRDEGVWCSETKELRMNCSNQIIDFERSPLRVGIIFLQDIYNKTLLSEQLENKYYMPGLDVGNRFMYSYFQNIVQMYKFTFEPKFAEEWGDKIANGNWTGLVGLMERKEIDVTLSPMVLTLERMEVALPLTPTMVVWMITVFKQPRAQTTYRAMLLELTPIVWVTFGLTVVLGAIVFALTEKHCHSSNYEGYFVLGCLQTIGIAANQGLSEMTESASSRLVCFTMMMGCLLVSMYYGAGTMRALLTKSPPFIKTLEQMLETNIPLSSINSPYINISQVRYRLFEASLAKRLGEKVQLFQTCEEGINSILNGSAFVGENYFLYNGINNIIKSNIICELTVFQAGLSIKMLHYVTDPHIRELFQRGILRSMESGAMQKERDYWLTRDLQCSPVAEFIHVPLSSVTVAIVIFAIGLILSATTLSFEFYFGRRLEQRKNRAPKKNKIELRSPKLSNEVIPRIA